MDIYTEHDTVLHRRDPRVILGLLLSPHRSRSARHCGDFTDRSFTAGIVFVSLASMAMQEYGKYILISRAHQHDGLEGWIPYASITWLDGKDWQYHHLQGSDRTFGTEQEALNFGFAVARD